MTPSQEWMNEYINPYFMDQIFISPANESLTWAFPALHLYPQTPTFYCHPEMLTSWRGVQRGSGGQRNPSRKSCVGHVLRGQLPQTIPPRGVHGLVSGDQRRCCHHHIFIIQEEDQKGTWLWFPLLFFIIGRDLFVMLQMIFVLALVWWFVMSQRW